MKIVIITGQTATGKTQLAVEYARKNNGELINADSRQVYKHLDIVTGKDKDQLEGVKMRLYDVVDPHKPFSSHDWVKLVLPLIDKLKHEQKMPIIVGGSYLYIKHLLYGVKTEGVGPNWELRRELEGKSVEELQELLKKRDLQTFEQLNESDRNNPRRLIRRIEILTETRLIPNFSPEVGPPIDSGPPSSSKNWYLRFSDIEFIGLRYRNRADLHQSLRKRVEERLNKGAVEEVKELLAKGYKLTDPGLSANACLEIYQYLTGEINQEELIDKWTTIEMQYAKRQYTFMKRDPNIKWTEL